MAAHDAGCDAAGGVELARTLRASTLAGQNAADPKRFGASADRDISGPQYLLLGLLGS